MFLYEKEIYDGVQKVYRYDNGYGASVVKHGFSYGNKEGLWEMALVRFFGEGIDDWELTSNELFPYEVEGYLTEIGVEKYLKKIENLACT